jgi:uncharacterized protein YegP (UPF0339 family)
MVTHPKFQVFTGKNDKFYFSLTARNGQKILSSQGYAGIASCKNGIESVRKNSQDDGRFERKTAADERTYFTLTATNGQVIGQSQMYKTVQGRDNGIEAVKRVAADAPVEDTTEA